MPVQTDNGMSPAPYPWEGAPPGYFGNPVQHEGNIMLTIYKLTPSREENTCRQLWSRYGMLTLIQCPVKRLVSFFAEYLIVICYCLLCLIRRRSGRSLFGKCAMRSFMKTTLILIHLNLVRFFFTLQQLRTCIRGICEWMTEGRLRLNVYKTKRIYY